MLWVYKWMVFSHSHGKHFWPNRNQRYTITETRYKALSPSAAPIPSSQLQIQLFFGVQAKSRRAGILSAFGASVSAAHWRLQISLGAIPSYTDVCG